jgi:hypothetical protein
MRRSHEITADLLLSEMDLMRFFGVIVEELVAMTDRDGVMVVMVEPLRSTTARDCLFGGVLRTTGFLGDFKTKVLRCFLMICISLR